MGTFFVTNDESTIHEIIGLMTTKGMDRHQIYNENSISILSFNKINVENYQNLFTKGEDFILGFGTYFYEGRFAEKALEAILDDLNKGFEVFSKVLGHFAFVVFRKQKLYFISDKTGTYHSFYAQNGDTFYLSSSLFAVAQSCGSLEVNKQECLEYLYTQATYGQKTIFSQIDHLDGGAIYSLAPFALKKHYYHPQDIAVSFDEYMNRATEYFQSYTSHSYQFNCDLSGGYDSRTVASLLEKVGSNATYNTNTNPIDPLDHRVAIALASAVGKHIEVFYRDTPGLTQKDLVENCFRKTEIQRDIFNGVMNPIIFHRKSQLFDLILGGYGGELLRSKYNTFKSIPDMIKNMHLVFGLSLPRKELTSYLANLKSKFEHLLETLDERDLKKGLEKIYYLEKMKYWGGSRITAFNQFCFRAHPLLDDDLAKYTFSFTLEDKQKAALQKRIITAASEKMAKVPSSYYNMPLYYKEGISLMDYLTYIPSLIQKTKFLLLSLYNKRSILKFFSPKKTNEFEDIFPPKGYLKTICGVDIENISNMKIMGRYLTLEKTLHHFRSQITNLTK